MSKTSFSYVIYIHAAHEDVWNGLLHPDMTRQYWFHENTSDWKPGSKWLHRRTDDEGTVDIQGRVLENDHPRRLVLTWEEPGKPQEASVVTFEISAQDDWPFGPWVALSLVHSELAPGSEMLESVSFGWPAVLSGLKSLVEAPEIFRGE